MSKIKNQTNQIDNNIKTINYMEEEQKKREAEMEKRKYDVILKLFEDFYPADSSKPFKQRF